MVLAANSSNAMTGTRWLCCGEWASAGTGDADHRAYCGEADRYMQAGSRPLFAAQSEDQGHDSGAQRPPDRARDCNHTTRGTAALGGPAVISVMLFGV